MKNNIQHQKKTEMLICKNTYTVFIRL